MWVRTAPVRSREVLLGRVARWPVLGPDPHYVRRCLSGRLGSCSMSTLLFPAQPTVSLAATRLISLMAPSARPEWVPPGTSPSAGREGSSRLKARKEIRSSPRVATSSSLTQLCRPQPTAMEHPHSLLQARCRFYAWNSLGLPRASTNTGR